MANHDVSARKTIEAQLIERAMTDPAFRAGLLADPKAVFARELGLDVPDSMTVAVLEETPSQRYLVLPVAVANAKAELSDTELAFVAGGNWSDSTQACGSCADTCVCRTQHTCSYLC